MSRRVLASCALALALLRQPAVAQSLFSIPTADTLETRAWDLELEQDSGASFRSPETLDVGTFRAGIADFLTVGFDVRLNQSVALRPNVSLRLTPRDARLGIGIGYENVGVRSFGEQPYAILSWRVNDTRVHLGWTLDDNGHQLMTGLEHPISPALTFQGDYITGSGSFLTAGFQVSLPADVTLTAGYMIPNQAGAESGIYLNLAHTGRF